MIHKQIAGTRVAEWRMTPMIEPSGCHIMTAMLPEEAAELSRLACNKQVLEIGAANGYSAIVMARAKALVTSIDNHCGTTWLGDTLTSMQCNLEAWGVAHRVRIIPQEDTTALPALFEDGRKFDLIFVDAGGSYDEVSFDLHWAKRLVHPGGIIAIHDYGHPEYPDKRRAADEAFPQGPDRIVATLFVATVP